MQYVNTSVVRSTIKIVSWSKLGESLPETEEEELRRIREFLLDGREVIERRANVAPAGLLAEQMTKREDDLDSGLRQLGYNRPERERLRRNRSRNEKPRDVEREKRSALQRLGFYIDQRVDWTTTDIDRTEAIAAWAIITKHDVDEAIDWWKRGVDPLAFAAVRKLRETGLRPTALFASVKGKTIAQHLREGNSIEWCISALRWELKP